MKKILCALFVSFFGVPGLAQQPTTAPLFVTASIKPGQPGTQGSSISFGQRQFVAKNASLKFLIAFAHNIPGNRVSGGPGWLTSDRYDINADASRFINTLGPGATGELSLVIQALLVERFKVKIHWDTREVPVYALVVDKNGPKLKAAPAEDGSTNASRGKITGRAPIARLARELENFLGRPVLDQTGLQGNFELNLEWTPDQSAPQAVPEDGAGGLPNGDLFPSLMTAVQEQLGLRLQSDRGQVPFLLVDYAEKASERWPPPVSFDRILHADREPQNWLTYSGNVLGHRFSPLTQINPGNVKNLELAWLWQAQSQEKFEATPLVVDGMLFTVQAPNDLVAIHAETGRVIWTHPYTPKNFSVCCGRVNRGLAISGGTLFMGTQDAHLLAIDASTGTLVWDTTVANSADPACQVRDECYAINHAPLAVKDKVIVGTAGGDGRIRGFIAAFDVKTGKEAWRFYTIPAPGEPGNETWSGDSWKIGGSGIWNIGAYDPDLNLTYWGTGNPNPNSNPDSRLGDNLYSDSVVALDADTGKLKWYFQFTPHDDMDWDSAQVPVLADLEWQGRQRKLILWANRNGLMYVLDRVTGEFLSGKPFVTVNWMSGFDEKGRPVRIPKIAGARTMPGEATNWYAPSYSSSTGLFYVPSLEQSAQPPYGAIRAFDPKVAEKKWEFTREGVIFSAGALTTASDLLFTGTRKQMRGALQLSLNEQANEGCFYALDARNGQPLWQKQLAGSLQAGPVTYAVGGKQYVVVAAGNTLFAFTLRQ